MALPANAAQPLHSLLIRNQEGFVFIGEAFLIGGELPANCRRAAARQARASLYCGPRMGTISDSPSPMIWRKRLLHSMASSIESAWITAKPRFFWLSLF